MEFFQEKSRTFVSIMSISIELKDLATGYVTKNGKKTIASGLNATLESGEMTCLLGPNGAGKSTLLRTLAAFQPVLNGTIEVRGKKLEEYTSKELSQVVSVVLTDNSDIKNMRAEEVVAMGRSPYTGFWGKLNEKDKTVIKKCLHWVGIEDLADRRMQTLSDGERQKVMIAKAVAQETPIILLDEPTAYLDYPSKIAMMLLLHRLAKALKKTIFMSTHDLEHALQVADQVWLLDKEQGLTTGLPEDLSLDGSIERYFSRDDMVFDRESCTFSITHETARDLIVEGDPNTQAHQLFHKALVRNGIRPVTKQETSEASKDVYVKIDANSFHLIEKGEESLCTKKMGPILRAIVPAITKHQISAIREAANLNSYE